MLGENHLSYIRFAKYFLPVCGLSSYFLDYVLWSTNVLKCYEVQLVDLLLNLYFWCHI